MLGGWPAPFNEKKHAWKMLSSNPGLHKGSTQPPLHADHGLSGLFRPTKPSAVLYIHASLQRFESLSFEGVYWLSLCRRGEVKQPHGFQSKDPETRDTPVNAFENSLVE